MRRLVLSVVLLRSDLALGSREAARHTCFRKATTKVDTVVRPNLGRKSSRVAIETS